MKIDHTLPIYEIVVNEEDETGINLISFVDKPAIEIKGLAFRDANAHDNCKCEIINGEWILQPDACDYCKEKKEEYEKGFFSFSAQKDKQIVVGPALIPNKLILRKDEDGSKYYVKFSEETIRKMVEKFMKGNDNRRINVDHSNKMVDGFIQQLWIVEDSVYDKSRFLGLNMPKGTVMIEVKVEDEDFWNDEIKGNGKFGFSIEGFMGERLVKLEEETLENTIDNLNEDELKDLFNFLLKQNEI